MIKILGVKVDNLSKTEILEKVRVFLSEKKFHQIATVNPEFILRAGEDQEFKNILNICDLNVADGFGIKLAFWRYGKNLKCRVAGIDLMLEVLKIASGNNLSVFLASNSKGLSSWEETRDAIHKTYPSLNIFGDNIDMKGIDMSNIHGSDIVFCNFGAPFQEKFLYSLKSFKDSKIRLGMGVGGSFDYLTGKVPRAPKFIRKIGFEWLWRLFVQPKRWKRILNAVIIFSIKIIFSKNG